MGSTMSAPDSPRIQQHPDRVGLHNEVHARPPEALSAPLAISHWVMMCDAEAREASRAHLTALLRSQHLPLPDPQANHFRMDMGVVHVRWELHTEFVTWTFKCPLELAEMSAQNPQTAARAVSQHWLEEMPGQCLSSLHLWVLPRQAPESRQLLRQLLHEDTLMGSAVAAGQAEVYTDLAIHADGWSRMVLLAGQGEVPAVAAPTYPAWWGQDSASTAQGAAMSPRRLGRLVQRLLEIETYRMTALLGLPVARAAAAELLLAESELAALAQAIREAKPESEPELLNRLTRLAGQVEALYAASHTRFSASSAYFELVDRRIDQIDESRLLGLQTLREFMDRRLSPARHTCEWAARRQDAMSQRVSRMSNLLRTRVEIEQQKSSQALLFTMNRRQGLQLQLQATVEGLSVAAITYYIVGLISYLAKGGQKLGWPYSPELTAALTIPCVALAVWGSLRRLHHKLFAQGGSP